MVFLQFPPNLTEEELTLQNKYAKLKKVRKKLAALKNPGKDGDGDKGGVAKKPGSSSSVVPEAKDAKEVRQQKKMTCCA